MNRDGAIAPMKTYRPFALQNAEGQRSAEEWF
jgi:hypothetical protein